MKIEEQGIHIRHFINLLNMMMLEMPRRIIALSP